MNTIADKDERYRILSMIFMVVGFAIVLMSVGSTLLGGLIEAITGTALPSFDELGTVAISKPQSLGLAIQMMLTQILVFGLPAMAGALLLRDMRWYTGFPGRPQLVQLALVPLIVAFILPLVNLVYIPEDAINLGDSFKAIEDALKDAETKASASLEPVLKNYPGLSLIAIAVFPAIFEELFFRGFLQQSLRRLMNVHVAVLLTAFIFSFIHGQVYGFFSRWLLGVALGYLVVYANSIIPSILAHLVYNGFQVVLVSKQLNGEIDDAVMAETESFGVWATLLATAVVIGLYWTYRRFYVPLPAPPSRPSPAFDVYSHHGEDPAQDDRTHRPNDRNDQSG